MAVGDLSAFGRHVTILTLRYSDDDGSSCRVRVNIPRPRAFLCPWCALCGRARLAGTARCALRFWGVVSDEQKFIPVIGDVSTLRVGKRAWLGFDADCGKQEK